jgi:hypothetical protein
MRSYAEEVRSGVFPSAAHSFGVAAAPAVAPAADSVKLTTTSSEPVH